MNLKKSSRTKSLSLNDDFPLRAPRQRMTPNKNEDAGKIIKYIDDNVIGKGVAFLGPFGRRKVVYADYASSGRSLQFLEDYINKEVLPACGDLACTSAVTGLQSQLFNNESRDLVRSAVNAHDEDEVVFFDGAYKGPVERICYLLCYQHRNQIGQHEKIASDRYVESPVLFVSICEPNKTLQPWIDAGAQIEHISKRRDGFLDLDDLEKRLLTHFESKRMLIGMFTGASRLTGILADDVATTILLHQYGAVSIWDFSPAASCAPVDMNPVLPGAAKDILFFGTNKFVGGVQAPGVLVIKKSLLNQCNGTLGDSVGVVGAVRAGLVIQLKESLGMHVIMARQEKICKQMLAHIRTIPEIVLLGPSITTAKKLPTLCFLVRHPRGAFLHHRFVVAVLNDVFGIQTTAGSHIGAALGMTASVAVEFEKLLSDDMLNSESIRPGYTRISFPFFMSESEMGFILEALKMVATEAWKLLPQYEVDHITGEWRHHSNSLAKERKWLGAIRYTDGKMLFSDRRVSGPGTFPQNYADCLQTARNLFNRARKIAQRTNASENLDLKLQKPCLEALRWFMLPGEAHALLLGHSQYVRNSVPFNPNRIQDSPYLLIMHRHNSLSALDVKRFKSRSLPASPIQVPQCVSGSGGSGNAYFQHNGSHSPILKSSDSIPIAPATVRFSLGGEVTTMSPPRHVANLIAAEGSLISRNRCHSVGSAAGLCAISPQTRINLGFAVLPLQRNSLHELQKMPPVVSTVTATVPPDEIATVAPTINVQQSTILKQKSPIKTSNAIAITGGRSFQPKQRLCSCSSQTDLFNESVAGAGSSGSTENLSPTPSLFNFMQAGSYGSDAENIQAYVKEMTAELATEIKSEIREVISQVEDVLESTDVIDMSSLNLSSLTNFSCAEDLKSDSVSATDVVEYLKEYSKEMTSEVKSEIRGMVSVFDDLKSPDPLTGLRKNSPPDLMEKRPPLPSRCSIKHRFSDVTPETVRPKSTECDKQRSESFPRPSSTQGWHQPTAQSPESSTPNCPYTGAISKLQDSSVTASQDSGINLYFHDADDTRSRSGLVGPERNRLPFFRSEQVDTSANLTVASHCRLPNSDCIIERFETSDNESLDSVQKSCGVVTKKIGDDHHRSILLRQSSEAGVEGKNSTNTADKWHHMPKEVWKQSAEALDEFNMLQDGDKVLVCLSGSSSSLSILHALRQFSKARDLHVDIGAISVGAPGVDPRALMLYMHDLGVEYYFEQQNNGESMTTRLSIAAKKRGYNVLAMGNTLDKLAGDFIVSILNCGRLHATQAHCTIEDNVRLIRPFIYVRERLLDEFAMQYSLPTRPPRTYQWQPDASNSILKVQESVNPLVYDNIKSALRPLLAFKSKIN